MILPPDPAFPCAKPYVRPELLLTNGRRPASLPAQDGYDPPRGQVPEVQEGDDRPGARGREVRPAAEDLRGGHRQGRGETPRGALAARHRARQPGDPAARGAGDLP